MFSPSRHERALSPRYYGFGWLLMVRCYCLAVLYASPMRPPRIRPCSFSLIPAWFTCWQSEWLSGFVLFCRLTACQPALYQVPVRQARGLPPASFRHRVTTMPLLLAMRFPPSGRARDFHPLEHDHAVRTVSRKGVGKPHLLYSDKTIHQSIEDNISNMVYPSFFLCYLSISWAKSSRSTITTILASSVVLFTN